jgi:uncharacterized C2H2 Zn-finger protein
MKFILTQVSYVYLAEIGDSWIDYQEFENVTGTKQDTVQLSSLVISSRGSQLYPKDFVILHHGAEQNSGGFNRQHPMNSLQSLTTNSIQSLVQDQVLTSPNQQSQQPHTKYVNTYKFPGAFPCPRCRKVYRYRTNMLRHLKVECGKEPQFQCPYCPCQTKHKSSMQRHIENRHSCK